jgi:hypothetical protein
MNFVAKKKCTVSRDYRTSPEDFFCSLRISDCNKSTTVRTTVVQSGIQLYVQVDIN